MLGSVAAEEETTSPQRSCRSRGRRQAKAPDIAPASPWQVPWKSSPQPSRARKSAQQDRNALGLFSVLPIEVSTYYYLGLAVEHPCTEGGYNSAPNSRPASPPAVMVYSAGILPSVPGRCGTLAPVMSCNGDVYNLRSCSVISQSCVRLPAKTCRTLTLNFYSFRAARGPDTRLLQPRAAWHGNGNLSHLRQLRAGGAHRSRALSSNHQGARPATQFQVCFCHRTPMHYHLVNSHAPIPSMAEASSR